MNDLPKYTISFNGLTNHIFKGQNEGFWKNKTTYEANSLVEIRECIENHYSILRPEEFETSMNHAFKLLADKDWVKMCGNRYTYKLVGNSGNPEVIIKNYATNAAPTP